ncbi:hypothetical protein CH251_02935 [Rhodococcus sp. 06-462-5]|nr:hypothetical protein CH251_02935 [Rhodococcus sp. 06-462-5]OZE62013.1 hypothetical protein CH270_20240 [Rhodococcus sp. 02-925g]
MTDSDEEFLTIGAFARSSGLTPSALRFYDDCALLVPAFIDAKSGYRYYTRAQAKRASIIRQLREIGLPVFMVIPAGSTPCSTRWPPLSTAGELRRSTSWIGTSTSWQHARGQQPRPQCPSAGCSTKILHSNGICRRIRVGGGTGRVCGRDQRGVSGAAGRAGRGGPDARYRRSGPSGAGAVGSRRRSDDTGDAGSRLIECFLPSKVGEVSTFDDWVPASTLDTVSVWTRRCSGMRHRRCCGSPVVIGSS